jgi:hypothetical protein
MCAGNPSNLGNNGTQRNICNFGTHGKQKINGNVSNRYNNSNKVTTVTLVTMVTTTIVMLVTMVTTTIEMLVTKAITNMCRSSCKVAVMFVLF